MLKDQEVQGDVTVNLLFPFNRGIWDYFFLSPIQIWMLTALAAQEAHPSVQHLPHSLFSPQEPGVSYLCLHTQLFISPGTRGQHFSPSLPSTYSAGPTDGCSCQIPVKQCLRGWHLAFGQEVHCSSSCSHLGGKKQALDRNHLHLWFWCTIRQSTLVRHRAVLKICSMLCNWRKKHTLKTK